MKQPFLLLIALAFGATSQGNSPNSRAPRDAPSFSSMIALSKPLVSIGSEDKEGPTLFGEITAVALDGNQNIYVLDRTTHSVRSFSRTGQFIASAGRAGRGPADLGWPVWLSHDGASRLYVFDHVNGIVVFETKGGVMTHVRTFGAEYQPTNACVLGDTLVVPGWREKKIVHVFSQGGDRLRSFGEGFNADTSEYIREMAARMPMRVYCDAKDDRIYVAPAAWGIVRAYQTDGKLLWEQTLPDYNGNRVFMSAQGGTVLYGTFSTSSISRLGQDLLVVSVRQIERVRSSQVNQFGGRGSEEDREPVTYILSARSGQLLARVTGVPLLGAVRGDFAVGYEHTPFPRVFTMSVRAAK